MADPFTEYEQAQFALLNSMGISANPDNLEHLRELLDVMAIYAERNAKYHGVWKQYGALANLVRGAQKVDRTMAVWWFDGEHLPPALDVSNLDDALDAINHLLFFMRCAKAGNLAGEMPNRAQAVYSLFGPDGIITKAMEGQGTTEDGAERERYMSRIAGEDNVVKLPWIDLDTP